MFIFFLSNLDMGGGTAATSFVSYVLASSATVLAEDTSLGDIDPGRATVLPEDASLGDIDPTRTTVIQ